MAKISRSKSGAVGEVLNCNQSSIKDIMIKDEMLSNNARLLTETFELKRSIRNDSESSESENDDFFPGEITDDDTESQTSLCYSDNSSEDNEFSEKSVEAASKPPLSPALRNKMGTPTLEDWKYTSFPERVRRLSDCMLAGVVVADNLKRNVGSRRERTNQSVVSDPDC